MRSESSSLRTARVGKELAGFSRLCRLEPLDDETPGLEFELLEPALFVEAILDWDMVLFVAWEVASEGGGVGTWPLCPMLFENDLFSRICLVFSGERK